MQPTLSLGLATGGAASAQGRPLTLKPRDRIVLVGNTLAERMQLFNHFETLLYTRFPDLQLTVRNLGWSGDTVALQPRPLNFGTTPTHLYRQKADVILAFFGLNESFDGQAGLEQFEQDLTAYLRANLAAQYNGTSAPRLVLVSPIAHERLARLTRVDVDAPQPRAGQVYRGHGPHCRAARRAVCRSVHADACADGARQLRR